ncbi:MULTISPECIES: dicarboxylate/amino acid:cation symporter [Chromobacterium]|uniref:Dicarboxylate/amino acid:cation symporter n=2 Tax=Chromobacterium TaxID=535 RepID=A0ABS3GLQ0_9NEIS|nr:MULTISPECIES: dicarboxylate/amino acid:cation symporter [Chromobacterium]AXT45606.1 dicarboxylate/amino acid:cation symporter [Chromobacterium rhizoryzae]MBK0414406.1 dicarboxylate/amino acid:cation symporter [Chromobacterium haemolyticum]MBO0415960.1 dicarboxylate/amino acid:cation symporter [Chromobacterium haemolyticum]MBO0499220.1 dicarboxylate/amino acid:cation symporter [Chromobacterium haemolyticum]OQS33776.1 dicarboxylate/amino acid:cation symporter [Chromobacterium haemolyticum]
MKLILKLLAGMAVGLALGLWAPDGPLALLMTFKALFGQFIGFMIPLIIVFYIMSGIAALESNSGKMLGWTVGLAYCSTILSGLAAFAVSSGVLPSLIAQGVHATDKPAAIKALFTLEIKPLFDVMTALMLAFVFGLGIAVTRAQRLKEVVDQGKDIVELVLAKVLIPLLPAYIACVFAEMAADGSVFSTLKTFGVVLVLAIAMHWIWLTLLYTVTGLASGRNPWSLIRNMLPAYLTALGTMSSAATIPVALRSAKQMKVSGPVADFVMPLCATIHLCGSTITLVTCATAVMLMTAGLDVPSWDVMFPFILLLGVTMVAAPGAPGGAVMSALGILASMLHFPEASLALMIALYLAQDSFGTACNVTGDGVIALWLDRIMGRPAGETDETEAKPASQQA